MKVRIEEGEPFDPYPWLTDYAAHLNEINRRRWFACPFFDLFAGAVVWTDETRRWPRQPRTATEVIWALRPLWAYRTSLMLDKPRDELEEYWQFGLEHFPKWVGFHPKRRKATRGRLGIIWEGQAQTEKFIEDLEKLVDG